MLGFIFFLDFFRHTRNRSRRRGAATNLSPSQKSEREWSGLKQRRTALYLNPSTPSHLVRACLSKYTLQCWPQEGAKAQTLPNRLCTMAAAVVACVVLMHPNSFLRRFFYNEYNSVKIASFFFQVRTLEVKRTGHRAALENYPVLPQLQVPARACPVFGFPH